ncbi:hypothetical protein [uncultured Chryseobacterium sp.]|mgnify:CR=1 FL=1|jgi:hypothetical protein|uniref:hypothetical protein n=1 Tax=uncultured Chryseobacterium sp. TaxID=259322 RepID=UPI002634D1D2|nr:hypothetical protein [uncultured Chryseobacterium sp.]
MIPEDNMNEQERKLKQMDYDPNEDLFNKEKHISLDGDGNPIEDEDAENMDLSLDVPGSEDDDEMEQVGTEDEENNYWSLSDNEDDHEETNTDLIN